MRYGIFSDVHSNLEALEAVEEAYKKESIDTYLCVGDVVGYAANPKECIERIQRLAHITVAGNHDWACINLLSTDYFNHYAEAAIRWTNRQLEYRHTTFLASLKLTYRNKDLILVHGTLHDPEAFDYMMDAHRAQDTLRLLKTHVCFVGHTHLWGIWVRNQKGLSASFLRKPIIALEEDSRYIVNVGSVGQPRDGNPEAAYCIYDTGKKEIRINRVPYDTSAARAKILNAGLPAFLGQRLITGN
jgi:putative phosphoesterase